MLHFLVAKRSQLRRYLREWGVELRGRTRLISYKHVWRPNALRDGTYIFCDIERLDPGELARAREIWDALARRGDRVRLLNPPHLVLRRRALLRALFENGSNRFNAYGLEEPRDGIRFPVFVRAAHEHRGPATSLLNDQASLSSAIDELLAGGRTAAELLIVEYLDTFEAGTYRKFAVIKVGKELLAQHIFFAKNWVVKSPWDWPPEHVQEDNAFLAENPHREEVDKVFKLANIDYGRIDYALLDGKMQVWEINTNPTLFKPKSFYAPERLGPKERLSHRLNAAFAALDTDAPQPRFVDRLASYVDLRR